VTNGTDFSCGLNSSYGEMSGDTRVSVWAGYIDDVVNGLVEMTDVGSAAPEPAAESETTAEAETNATNILPPNGKYFIDSVFSRTMRARIK